MEPARRMGMAPHFNGERTSYSVNGARIIKDLYGKKPELLIHTLHINKPRGFKDLNITLKTMKYL